MEEMKQVSQHAQYNVANVLKYIKKYVIVIPDTPCVHFNIQ